MATNTQGIMKMSYPHRRLLVRVALLFALAAVCLIAAATFTNEWIHTAEVLKFWVSNETNNNDMFDYERAVVYKNSTFGALKMCWRDPATPISCHNIEVFPSEVDAADLTGAIELSLSKMVFMMLATVSFTVMGAILSFVCVIHEGRRNLLTLAVGVCHIFAGMQNLLTLVVFLSAVLGEVGHKLTAESPIDDPAFLYACGYSFYCAVVAFMCTEVSAALSLCVYMAAHDERMYNRYHIRTIMKGSGLYRTESLGQKRKIGGPQGRRYRRSSSGALRGRSFSSSISPKVSETDMTILGLTSLTSCSLVTDSGVFTDVSSTHV